MFLTFYFLTIQLCVVHAFINCWSGNDGFCLASLVADSLTLQVTYNAYLVFKFSL